MVGDLIGMDGTTNGEHSLDAIALENSSVCRIRYGELEELTSVMPNLEQRLKQIIMREVMRQYGNMLVFYKMRPEERFALFLLNFSTRYAARGYSRTRFKLRMPHEDIGNYLGLTFKTLNGVFSRLQEAGVIEARNGSVEIKDLGRLKKTVAIYIAWRGVVTG
jgi:CRP/FNR family transcriptional regulator, anaerobic regulatory protein